MDKLRFPRTRRCDEPQFLNSGGYIGRAAAFRHAVRSINAYPASRLQNAFGAPDDQVGFVHYWLAGANQSRAPDKTPPVDKAPPLDKMPPVALDYGARLFLTLPRFRSGALLRTPSGTLAAAWAPNSALCFVHPAGSKRPEFAREGGFNYSILGLY